MKYFLQRNRRTAYFLLALAVSFVLISGFLAGRIDTRGTGLAERLMVWAVSPLQQGVGTLRGLAQILWYDYLNLVGLREKNVLLQARVAILENELHRAREESAATERLAKLLLFKVNSDFDLKTARVIGRDGTGWAGTVTIDLGTRDGIEANMAVVAGRGGVVGRVVRLHPAYAQVLLLTDYNSAVDAVVQRTRDKGVLAGQGTGCELKYVERQADVQAGDTVVTSGVGGIFPPGLLLGTVRAVNREGPGLFQSIAVAPAMRPDRLEEVQVVLRERR